MENKKYKLTDETTNLLGRILYRIEALKDFGDVKEGDKGGYVENHSNLSQYGNCWIYDTAKVYSTGYVWGNARICDNAHVYDGASVYDDAIVSGNVYVYDHARICGDAKISELQDYMVFKNWWSDGNLFTWTRSNNMWRTSFFYGTGDELIKNVYHDNEESAREYERVVKYVEDVLKDETKKYKLTDETINLRGITLYRIEALTDFCNVKRGDKGGFVQCKRNLSQEGQCWVYDDACVYGLASVKGNATVCNKACVYGNAVVYEDACVYGNAQVYGDALVYGNSHVYGETLVCGYARVYDESVIYDNAWVSGDALVCEDAEVCGDASICGNAIITELSDYIVFKNWWSSGRHFTWTRSNNMWSVGCFYGTGEELIKKAYQDSKKSGLEYERIVHYVEDVLKSENNGNKKYRLTDETVEVNGKTLYRIEALKDFSDVKTGDKGGFVESELNLSQEGNCWIYDDGCAYENAIVTDNAQVYDNAKIHGNVRMSDDAVVCGNVHLCGDINACQYQIF